MHETSTESFPRGIIAVVQCPLLKSCKFFMLPRLVLNEVLKVGESGQDSAPNLLGFTVSTMPIHCHRWCFVPSWRVAVSLCRVKQHP